MSLSTILSYRSFPLPIGEPSISSDMREAEASIKKLAGVYEGDPVFITRQDLPTWYYLLLLKHLSRISPEVVCKMESGIYVVLHTIYQNDVTIARPESVHLFAELFTPPPSPSQPDAVAVDLRSLPTITPANIGERIRTMQKTIPSSIPKVVFSGTGDPLTALIAYTLWRSSAHQCVYTVGETVLAL